MIIISISVDGNMNEIDLKNSNDILTELISINKLDLELLYNWNYDNNIIRCYGNYQNTSYDLNNHKLPMNGISNILYESSNEIQLYGNIYILLLNNEKLQNYYISDYGNFHYITNELDNIDEEIIDTSNLEEVTNNDNILKKKKIINNISNVLNYDTNNYLKI